MPHSSRHALNRFRRIALLAAEKRTPDDAARPTLSDALQDLGLRLESTKAPVEMFVVEHFERPPQN